MSRLGINELYKTNKLKQSRLTKPRNNQQTKTRNPSLGAHNDKNHCRLIKASDKPINIERQTGKTKPKTLITDLDRDTSTYNPNRPSYFSMQTENNPSKRNSRAFEKAQSMVTKGFQTNNTVFIKKIN